jgi:CYTH domain-containing protein
MKTEIERKYLIDVEKLPELSEFKLIEQGYLSLEPETRIRVVNNKKSFITVKSKGFLSRSEIECEIPLKDGISMLSMCKSQIIKVRYMYKQFNSDTHIWEIDRFMGPLAGLWLAEVELTSAEEKIELPEFILEEVTYKPEYKNINLATAGLESIIL